MKALLVFAALILAIWFVGPTVADGWRRHEIRSSYDRVAQDVKVGVYSSKAAVPSFTPGNPEHVIEQREDGLYRFAGTAFVPTKSGTYVDRWEAIYDPAKGAAVAARSISSIDPAGTAKTNGRAQAASSPTPRSWMWKGGRTSLDKDDHRTRQPAPPPGGSPTGERTWSQLPNGQWINHDRGVSAMHSIGGG